MSGDKEQEYFSDGMTEDLITDLSKIPGLTVISRTSTSGYKGRKIDIREVGEALNVRYVIEGSIATIVETQPIQDPGCLSIYKEGLRKAGIPK